MTEEIHDHSRVDGYLRARQKVAFLHAVWPPMLAGAAGAALVIGAVWVVLPKVSYREVEVPRVTLRDVEVPKITMRDIEGAQYRHQGRHGRPHRAARDGHRDSENRDAGGARFHR